MRVDFKLSLDPKLEGIDNYNKNIYFLEADLWKDDDLPGYLKKLLREKFPSIVFIIRDPMMYNMFFKFIDNADEAAFLLWSSDGVDL